MVAMTVQAQDFHPHLRLTDRLAALAAWSLGIALFSTVGWIALKPVDPEGAVTMRTDPSPWMMLAQMAALGVVVAGVATVLIGRKLTDAGVFACCLGIAVANLRGNTFASVLIGVADGGVAIRREIAAGFMSEAVAWFVMVMLVMAFSAIVLRWCSRGPEAESVAALSSMSAVNLPMLGAMLYPRDPDVTPEAPDSGLKHTLAVAFVAFLLVRVFATGSPPRAIAHGQVYFSIAAAFCAAGYVVQGYLPTRTPLWTCLAVPLVTLLAYGWSIMTDSSQGLHPATIPTSPYFRALPIEYVSLGVLGSLLSFWWTRGAYAARLVPKAKETKRGAAR